MIYSMFASYSHEISANYIPQVPMISVYSQQEVINIHRNSQLKSPFVNGRSRKSYPNSSVPTRILWQVVSFASNVFPETATTIPNDFQRPGFAWKNPGPLGCPGQHVTPGLYWPPRPSRRWGCLKTPHRIHRLVVSSW
jgi:hypothetical protein